LVLLILLQLPQSSGLLPRKSRHTDIEGQFWADDVGRGGDEGSRLQDSSVRVVLSMADE
jgi:hypothetical protein